MLTSGYFNRLSNNRGQKSCKDREYLSALRERHNCKVGGKTSTLKEGDVVIVRGGESNRGKWSLGVVADLFEGRDRVVRAAKLLAGKSFLERPVQHLFPLELACRIPQIQTPSHDLPVLDETPRLLQILGFVMLCRTRKCRTEADHADLK